MNDGGLNAALFESSGDDIGGPFGLGKDDCSFDARAAEDLFQERLLFALFDEQHPLFDLVDGCLFRSYVDRNGVFEQALGQLNDVWRHRRREKQRLSLVGELANDPFEIGQEAHVEHSVGFVQCEIFQFVEFDVSLIHQVEQSAGGCHNDVDALVERADLTVLTYASVNHGLPQSEVASVRRETLFDLDGEFTGGGQNQGERPIGRCLDVLLAQCVENGHREGGRFSGSRLSATKNVAALKGDGNRLRLDRSWSFVLVVFQGAVQWFDQFNVCKSLQWISLRVAGTIRCPMARRPKVGGVQTVCGSFSLPVPSLRTPTTK